MLFIFAHLDGESCGTTVICFVITTGAITKEMNSRLKKDKSYKNACFKAFVTVLKHLLFDENVQVNGFIMLEDFTGYTMAHFTTWTRDEMKDMMKWQVRACV